MKKFFTYLFVFMGVLFFLQLIALSYFYIVDPLNIKPFIFGAENKEEATSIKNSQNDTEVRAEAQAGMEALPVSNLSPAQERALNLVGIEPEEIPQSFTEEQLRCFVGVLGEARVNEIKAGAIPTMSEYYQGKDCI